MPRAPANGHAANGHEHKEEVLAEPAAAAAAWTEEVAVAAPIAPIAPAPALAPAPQEPNGVAHHGHGVKLPASKPATSKMSWAQIARYVWLPPSFVSLLMVGAQPAREARAAPACPRPCPNTPAPERTATTTSTTTSTARARAARRGERLGGPDDRRAPHVGRAPCEGRRRRRGAVAPVCLDPRRGRARGGVCACRRRGGGRRGQGPRGGARQGRRRAARRARASTRACGTHRGAYSAGSGGGAVAVAQVGQGARGRCGQWAPPAAV